MERLVLISVLALCALGDARADSRTGVISSWSVHYNSGAHGPCIQVAPALPGKGYACALSSSPTNYKETVAALMTARMTGQTVSVFWDYEESDGTKIIAMVVL